MIHVFHFCSSLLLGYSVGWTAALISLLVIPDCCCRYIPDARVAVFSRILSIAGGLP